MNNLFNEILANTSADMTIAAAVITMLAAILLGVIIASAYYFTQEETYHRSMAITLLMLPVSRRRTIRTRPKALKTGFFFVVAYRHPSYCRSLKP